MKKYSLEEVSEKLSNIFNNMGYMINVDETYLTSVAVDFEGNRVVEYSESLSRVILEKVLADEIPAFNTEYTGIFSKQWTFDPLFKIPALDAIDLATAGKVVVESYRNK